MTSGAGTAAGGWTRRAFLHRLGLAAGGALTTLGARGGAPAGPLAAASGAPGPAASPAPVTLFLCGDVMTGRGIDQVRARSVDPTLHEPYVRSAAAYVALAERRHGPIPRPVAPDYVWGDALDVLAARRPDVRLINLETAVTAAGSPWPDKGIHYRMHPANVDCLCAAGVDCCVLANNHVLDWGRGALAETLDTLAGAGLATAGAGVDAVAAAAPAVVPVGGNRRVLVYAVGHPSSGIPRDWAATAARSGVALLPDLSPGAVATLATRIRATARAGDLVVLSVHWGGNWGYEVPRRQQDFARAVIDEARVDVVHGHSSHHPKAIEVHRGRPILYGCGDFLNDYEGIEGHAEYRGDLTLMYFPRFGPDGGGLQGLELVPLRIARFRLQRAADAEARWLADRLDRECRRFGAGVTSTDDGTLALRW